MSRIEFRAPVSTPRPLGALLMVATATSMLGLTEQLAPWALALTAVAPFLGFGLLKRPMAWQRRPWLLNSLLAASAVLSLALYLNGAIAMVALAHFAVLTAWLQFFDIRPRKTEFLLVAIALFNVVLAANLTDSMLFPPLLLLFAVCAIWTLMVHTIRAEAHEAGDPAGGERALGHGLRGLTVVSSVATLLIALAIFPILPRVRSGAFLTGGLGASFGVSGFSDRVELGDLGRIRLDPTVALRIETLEGDAPPAASAYWRGLAFDTFDGRSWSVTPQERTPIPGSSEFGIALGVRPRGPRLIQRIIREPVSSGVLFAPGDPVKVRGALGRLEHDVNGGVYGFHTASKRVSYEISSVAEAPSEAALREDRARLDDERASLYLAVPELTAGVEQLATRLTAPHPRDHDKVSAVVQHLRSAGRYTNEPPAHGRDGTPPIESFLLGETAGHCEYFASGMVVLLRSVGIPARLVNGFAGGRPNTLGGFVEVTRSDAHTWVEVHYEDAGWVRYDPTPPDLRLAGADALSAYDRFDALRSAIEYFWFRNVIDFDRGRQAQAMRGAWLAWRAWRDRDAQPRPEQAKADTRRPELGALARPLAVALVVGAAAFLFLGRRRGRAMRGASVPAFYQRALRLMASKGAHRGPSITARAFAREVADAFTPEVAGAFGRVTELYLAERFGGRSTAAGDAALLTLRDSLRR